MTQQALVPQADLAFLQTTLDSARRGGATLGNLARAHEIATAHDLPETVREIRRHIYTLIPPLPETNGRRTRTIFGSIAFGVAISITSLFIMKHTGIRDHLMN